MEVIELTKKLVGVAQVSDEIKGRNSDLEDFLKSEGFTINQVTTINPKNGHEVPNYLAERGEKHSSDKKIGFVGHWDVVPYGEGWTSEPNVAEIKDGFLYGRGVCDMLGGVAAMIEASKNMSTDTYLRLYLPGDEETTSLGMPALLEEYPSSELDFCIGGEPTSNRSPGDAIKIGRRGVLRYNIYLSGDQVHTAYISENPDASLLNHLLLEGVFCPLTKIDLNDGTEYIPSTTVAYSLVKGVNEGESLNSIPGTLQLSLDIRHSPRSSREDIEKKLHEVLNGIGVQYTLENFKQSDSYLTDPDSDLVRKVKQAIVDINPGLALAIDVNCKGGTSDCRFITGIPVVELGLENSTIHQTDERQSIEHLKRLAQIYQKILTN